MYAMLFKAMECRDGMQLNAIDNDNGMKITQRSRSSSSHALHGRLVISSRENGIMPITCSSS